MAGESVVDETVVDETVVDESVADESATDESMAVHENDWLESSVVFCSFGHRRPQILALQVLALHHQEEYALAHGWANSPVVPCRSQVPARRNFAWG